MEGSAKLLIMRRGCRARCPYDRKPGAR